MESPDFYGCIYRAQGKLEETELIVFDDNAHILRFCASPSESGLMFLSLQLYELTDTLPLLRERLWDEKIHDILNCNVESMQNKLLPLLSYMFLGLFFDFPLLENKFSASDMEESQNSDIQAGIVGSTEYKKIFNRLFSVMSSFFLNTYKGLGGDVGNVDRNRDISYILAKAREEILEIIEPAKAHRFMKFLASIRPHNDEGALTISYRKTAGGFCRIASYSPLVSLEKTRESRVWKLNSSDRFSLLNFIFQFTSCVVKVGQSFTEVHLQMDNVTCDVLRYKARISRSDVPNEEHFPTKICLTIGSENGHGVQSVSLGVSSPNPVTDIGEGNTWEATLQPPNTVGFKLATATTSTRTIKNWGFELSPVNSTDAKMDWTLYDATTRKPVCNSVPSKFPFRKHKTPSYDGALTEQGGVVFAKDYYGKPIIWRLNRDLEEQKLKWIVEASIWVTYEPNSLYSETLHHKFRQEFDFKLNTTSTPN